MQNLSVEYTIGGECDWGLLYSLVAVAVRGGKGVKLTIYQCDRCKADCSAYEQRVGADFPFGEQYDLCIKCARELFPKKEESEVVK